MSVSDKGFAIKRMHLHSPNLSTPQSLEGLFTTLNINLDASPCRPIIYPILKKS